MTVALQGLNTMLQTPIRLKDSFTCQTSWQGSRMNAGDASSLIRLVHLPGKLAGVHAD